MANGNHKNDGRVKPQIGKAGVTRGTRTYPCGGKVNGGKKSK